MDSSDLQKVSEYMPWFLDGKSKSDLFESVSQLAKGEIDYSDYFEKNDSKMPKEISQGDVLEALPIINLPSTGIENQPAMILSNSCSIAPEKDRTGLPLRVVYAPVVSFEKLAALINNVQIMEEIRLQQKMQCFYLPAGEGNDEEKVVLFDQSLSMLIDPKEVSNTQATIRLNLKSWYHLLIKLTAYYARITQDLVLERSA